MLIEYPPRCKKIKDATTNMHFNILMCNSLSGGKVKRSWHATSQIWSHINWKINKYVILFSESICSTLQRVNSQSFLGWSYAHILCVCLKDGLMQQFTNTNACAITNFYYYLAWNHLVRQSVEVSYPIFEQITRYRFHFILRHDFVLGYFSFRDIFYKL